MSVTLEHSVTEISHLVPHWARIRARLRSEVGELEYRTWLRQMTLSAIDGDEITVLLPTRFLCDWVRSHYGDRLNLLWNQEQPAIRRVDIRVGGSAAASSGLAASLATVTDPPATVAKPEERMDQRPDLMIDPRFTFDAFVVGKPNEFAYACARRVAEQPSSPGFNPLFLYGGVGLGKTHLMHAIAWEMVARATNGAGRQVSVAYMSAEKFMYRFITAIRSQSTIQFKEQLRSVDVLMIDDLQFLIGKDNTQEEFFHTFNALVDVGKQIVVSADKSPSDLSGLDDRLRTRLGYGMVADLHATTFELRISILEAKASRAGVAVPAKILDFLAHKITSNVRELEGALNRLVAHANLFGRPITIETTQEVLHDVLKAHDRRVTIEEIQKRVAEHFSVRLTDMSSARRAQEVAR
ncbi:MAG TPA: chromosomal replication initiator protein DnaA, partial [Acetobacteraceae bacterium]|nr:chromosomal replication initiator protein DnaA [Acetobacteraceae bacterium]